MIRNLIAAIILFISFNSSAQNTQESIIFNIIHKNKVIGSLKAEKIVKDSCTNYKSITHINTRIIKKIQVIHEYEVTFKNQQLTKAKVNISVNNKQQAKTVTAWEQNTYQVFKNEKYQKSISQSITYATIQLYFEEPKNVSNCYSEQNGDNNSIIDMGNHVYKKINTKNNENQYYYEKGQLTKATIDGGLINFEIVRQTSS